MVMKVQQMVVKVQQMVIKVLKTVIKARKMVTKTGFNARFWPYNYTLLLKHTYDLLVSIGGNDRFHRWKRLKQLYVCKFVYV